MTSASCYDHISNIPIPTLHFSNSPASQAPLVGINMREGIPTSRVLVHNKSLVAAKQDSRL